MTETAQDIDFARKVLDGDHARLAGLIASYDSILADDEQGIFSWHQALYDIAREARKVAEKIASVSVTKGDTIRIIPERGPERLMAVAHVEHHVITLSDPGSSEEGQQS